MTKLDKELEIELVEPTRADKEYILSIFPPLKKIKDTELQTKVIKAWVTVMRKGKWEKLDEFPWIPPFLHGMKGFWEFTSENMIRLVDHLNTATNIAIDIANRVKDASSYYPGLTVNMDYVIAAENLHDVERLLEYNVEKPGEYPEAEKYFSHGYLGAYVALKVGLPAEIAHAIRAHTSGTGGVPPRTLEARICRIADRIENDLWLFYNGKPTIFISPGERLALASIFYSYGIK